MVACPFRKSLALLAAVAAVAGLGGLVNSAKADNVVTQFTFESNYTAPAAKTTTLPPVSAETGTGSGTVSHATASQFSAVSGNGSAVSLSSNTWALGDYYQFSADLTGVTASELEFDQVSSGTGPASFKVQISTDGSIFTDLPGGDYTVSTSVSFSSGSAKTQSPPRYLFNISALDGLSTAAIRLVDTAATGASAGTDRIDNVTFGSNLTPPTPAPEPASLAMLTLGGLALLARRRRSA